MTYTDLLDEIFAKMKAKEEVMEDPPYLLGKGDIEHILKTVDIPKVLIWSLPDADWTRKIKYYNGYQRRTKSIDAWSIPVIEGWLRNEMPALHEQYLEEKKIPKKLRHNLIKRYRKRASTPLIADLIERLILDSEEVIPP